MYLLVQQTFVPVKLKKEELKLYKGEKTEYQKDVNNYIIKNNKSKDYTTKCNELKT